MSDADLVAVGGLSALAVIVTVVLAIQIRRRRRLVAKDEIAVSVMSEWKGMIILLSWIAIAVAATPFIISLANCAKLGDLGDVLLLLLLEFIVFGVGFFPCMRLTPGWRRDGELRCTLDRLSLSLDGKEWSLDLQQPFELFEWSWTGPSDTTQQAVVFRQGDVSWGISYPLGVRQKQYDNSPPVDGPRTMLGPDASRIHERLRSWRPSGGRAWL